MEGTQQKPLAAVTGASSGIGFELAKVFGEEGFDLLLAAEDEELDRAGAELRATGAAVAAHRVDLATEAGVIELYRRIGAAGRPLEAIACNAGRGAGGAFATETALEDELEIVDLNVRSNVHLSKLVLRNELKDSGVTVTSLMPGPTETEFFEVAEMGDTKVGAGEKDDPAQVARQGYEALMAGEERVVAGSWRNKAQVAAGKVMPDSVKAELHRRLAEPGSGEEDGP